MQLAVHHDEQSCVLPLRGLRLPTALCAGGVLCELCADQQQGRSRSRPCLHGRRRPLPGQVQEGCCTIGAGEHPC
jgi:hypothetical protein